MEKCKRRMLCQSSQSNPSRWKFHRYWKFPLCLMTYSSATNMGAQDIVYLIRQACDGIVKKDNLSMDETALDMSRGTNP